MELNINGPRNNAVGICRIAVIGAGAMGSAVVKGLVSAGMDPGKIIVANPHDDKLAPLRRLGVSVTTDNRQAVCGASLVVVAVKPWILPSVVAEIKDCIDYGCQEVTVIVAGVSCGDLRGMFLKTDDFVAEEVLGTGGPEERIAAATPPLPVLSVAMPNTAMVMRESMTFVVEAEGNASQAVDIFGMLGKVMVVEEKLLPAGMALASCGIAYAMRYVRAAVEGGVELGFKASQAQQIVVETLRGAAALLSREGAHPESEIDKVTTPGGLTIRGLNAMERAGFTPAVIAGLKECVASR